MNVESDWNDESRKLLKDTLREIIVGELRLAKFDRDDILDTCRTVYIDEDCPAEERDAFIQFASDEFDHVQRRLEAEQAEWPDETDCDRLDRVEAALREVGILFWQASPCCDTCTGAEIPDRIEDIDGRFPGFREQFRGYAFFIEQCLPEMLADDTQISVYLAYGWNPPDEEVDPTIYEQNSLAIAREVCQFLRNEGFEVDWNGDFSRKIGVSINWQRRTMLE